MQSKPKTIEIQGRVTKSYIFTLADGSLLAKVAIFTDNKVSCKEHTLTIRESEICPRERILAIKKKDVIHATGEKRLIKITNDIGEERKTHDILVTSFETEKK